MKDILIVFDVIERGGRHFWLQTKVYSVEEDTIIDESFFNKIEMDNESLDGNNIYEVSEAYEISKIIKSL